MEIWKGNQLIRAAKVFPTVNNSVCDAGGVFTFLMVVSVTHGDVQTWGFVGWPELCSPSCAPTPFSWRHHCAAVGVDVFCWLKGLRCSKVHSETVFCLQCLQTVDGFCLGNKTILYFCSTFSARKISRPLVMSQRGQSLIWLSMDLKTF